MRLLFGRRNIKGFIVQGGDPTGTGKGGKSIFDTYLEDEFHPELTVCLIESLAGWPLRTAVSPAFHCQTSMVIAA